MSFLRDILSTIRLPKKSSKPSKHPKSSKSEKSFSRSPKPVPEDDQRNLYAFIETWLESTKDAPAPGHRFNGHTLGQPRLTPRNLAMLNDGLRPMPVFGPQLLTSMNLKIFKEGMGPYDGVGEIFGLEIPKVECGREGEASESGATTGSSRLSA